MGGRGSQFKTKSKYKLNYNEETAVLNYFSSDSYKINEKLYLNMQLDKNDKDFVKNFDNALQKMPYTKGETLTRDLTFPFSQMKEQFIERLKVGEIISNEAYWSATTSKEYQEVPDVRLVFKNARKARDMRKIEDKGENEVIYERNSRFEILSKKTIQKYGDYDIIVVELKEL